MRTGYWSTLVVIGLGVLSRPTQVLVQQQDEGRQRAAADWGFFGGDWTSARYSALARINTETVKGLNGAWTFKFDGNASTRATPVVKDGVMFISAGTRLYALDAKTGTTL